MSSSCDLYIVAIGGERRPPKGPHTDKRSTGNVEKPPDWTVFWEAIRDRQPDEMVYCNGLLYNETHLEQLDTRGLQAGRRRFI